MRCSSCSSLIAFILPLLALAAPLNTPDANAITGLQQLSDAVKDVPVGLNSLAGQIALISGSLTDVAFTDGMDRVSTTFLANQRPANAEYVDKAHLHARHCLTFLLTAWISSQAT